MNYDRDIKFDIVIGHHKRSNSAFSKFSRCLPFSKWLPKHGIKKFNIVRYHQNLICGLIMMSWIDSQHWKITTGHHFQNGCHKTAQIQHCPISTTFHMWVDYDVPNLFLTSKNFYRSPFSKWPPQYRTNSTLFDFKGSF